MTPEAQRIAIAEACGWTECNAGAAIGYPRGCAPKASFMGLTALPDYPNDLNAMHSAEKTLKPEDLQIYNDLLFDNVNVAKYNRTMLEYWHFHASAAERAEAFLKTVNLWKP